MASRLSLLYLLSLVLFGLTRQPFELFEEDILEVINFHNDLSFDFGIRQRKKGYFVSIGFPYLKGVFIAFIHPIQWTIALPVGATGPAKRQKKTSCI